MAAPFIASWSSFLPNKKGAEEAPQTAGYRPETHIHVRFQEGAAFKQVELRLVFNKLKTRYIHVPPSQHPITLMSGWRWLELASILT